MRTLIIFILITLSATSAHADAYVEIVQFARAICDEVPEGAITRTSIQGKIAANAGLFARIFSGLADVSGSKTEEIYKGIPFEKLTNGIPTAAMCRKELAELLIYYKQKKEMSTNIYCSPNRAAEIGALWVLNQDTGARRRYDVAREEGFSRFNALMKAQGHKQGIGARTAFTAWGEDCVDLFARQNGG